MSVSMEVAIMLKIMYLATTYNKHRQWWATNKWTGNQVGLQLEVTLNYKVIKNQEIMDLRVMKSRFNHFCRMNEHPNGQNKLHFYL